MIYGCYNRSPFKDSFETGNPIIGSTTVPFTMSKDCQYTKSELGQKDAKCIGCKWKTPVTEKKDS